MIREKAYNILKEYNPYGAALENHCIRLAEFTLALAGHQQETVDEDLVYAGAYLHDIGLLVNPDDTPNYLYRSAAFAGPLMEQWGLDKTEIKEMTDMLVFNHSLASIKGIAPVAELMRCAVQVEHSFGVWPHGLSREIRQKIFATYPRKGLNGVLKDFFKTTYRRDGLVEMVRLFFPAERTAF